MRDRTGQTKRKEILMKHAVWLVLILGLLFGTSFAEEKVYPRSEKDRFSYSYGYQMGENLKLEGINLEALVKGIQDGLSGTEPMLTSKEMQKALVEFNRRNVAVRRAQKQQMAERYRGEGREFLTANANNPGVITLPSGLQYKVIREGSGSSPGPHDAVTVHYRGTLINGTEFDSSYSKGKSATFRVDGVIKGWTEALQLMKEGAKWQLFIPPDLAYGERGPLADKTLIFDVELISVN